MNYEDVITGTEQDTFSGGVTWNLVTVGAGYTGSWSTSWMKTYTGTISITAAVAKDECGQIASRDYTYTRTDVESIRAHGTLNFDHQCIHGLIQCGHPTRQRTKVLEKVTPELEVHGCSWAYCGVQKATFYNPATTTPSPLPTVTCSVCPVCH